MASYSVLKNKAAHIGQVIDKISITKYIILHNDNRRKMKFTVITKLNMDVETEEETVPLVGDMIVRASVIKSHLIPFNF
jgi:hypothetical protein